MSIENRMEVLRGDIALAKRRLNEARSEAEQKKQARPSPLEVTFRQRMDSGLDEYFELLNFGRVATQDTIEFEPVQPELDIPGYGE